ncbi:MAG TPA: hypothetical protein VNV42_13450 [Solirubrobacteraceae bacterium]|jgi:hypothetical protein|nr:hypothetical protein [Solirubrobacteraceae bacterium]
MTPPPVAAPAGRNGDSRRRRVSPDFGPPRRSARSAGPRTAPRPASRPASRPRRLSGPATSRQREAALAGAGAGTLGLRLPLPGYLRLPDRLIDRLIGGRTWIAVIAFALIGIVAMQLWVVKLGVGIGRALEHTQLLQRENAVLAGEDSALSSAERIERLALAKGMVFASPGALHFDKTRGSLDVRLAAGALAKPAQSPTTPATTTTTTPPAAGSETEPAGEATLAAGTQPANTTRATAGSTSETQSAPTTTPEVAASTGVATSPAGSTETAAPTAVAPGGSSEAAAPTAVAPAGSSEAASPASDAGGGTPTPGG